MTITLVFGMAVDANPAPSFTYDSSLNVPIPAVGDYLSPIPGIEANWQVAQRDFEYSAGDLKITLFKTQVGPKRKEP